MTILMEDAVSVLSPDARRAYERSDLADLKCADDTMLLGTSVKHVQEMLQQMRRAAQQYCLELHAGKFQLL